MPPSILVFFFLNTYAEIWAEFEIEDARIEASNVQVILDLKLSNLFT